MAKIVAAANVVLIAGGVLATAAWLYCIYYYGWTGERQLSGDRGIIFYYVCPAIVASLFFASLRLESSYKINLAVVCIALAVCFYGGELLLVVVNWIHEPPKEKNNQAVVQLAKQFGIAFDARSKLEVVNDLRERGIDAVPAIIPEYLLDKQNDGTLKSSISIDGVEVQPLSGIANKTTVLCNEGGEFAIYQSDEHGFHNPKGIWQLPGVDVAAIGDSFTQGWCVPSGKNFVDVIRKQYPATLNLGMEGSGPLLELAELKEYLPPLRPKTVLWFYFEGNDLSDLKKEATSKLMMRYLESNFSQRLRSRQRDLDEVLIRYIRWQEERHRNSPLRSAVDALPAFVKLSAVRQQFGLIYGANLSEKGGLLRTEEANIALLQAILLQAKSAVSSWGGVLDFVYLPTWERYVHPESVTVRRDSILNLVKHLDIPVIDLHPVFQASGDPLSLFPFRRGWHYNEKGHRLVGEEALRFISRNPMAPSRPVPALSVPVSDPSFMKNVALRSTRN